MDDLNFGTSGNLSEGLIDGMSIDRQIAQANPCPECGGEMVYKAIVNGKSYRAFAVCDNCGYEFEF